MAGCRFSKDIGMYDVTPVENIFIDEFMVHAPGDYVKVYLYGLKLCYSQQEMEPEAIASALNMETAAVHTAFAHWQRQGILQVLPDGGVEYFNVQHLLSTGAMKMGTLLNRYEELNRELQRLFGNRMLTAQEYERFYDWVEVYGLAEEVVTEVVQYGIGKHARGNRVPISYLEAIAKGWAEEGVTTAEAARVRGRLETAQKTGIQRVLNALGQRRSPTVYELELFEKWTGPWQMELAAILDAGKQTTRANNPSFAYLDAILQEQYQQGNTTAEAMRLAREQREAQEAPLRSWLKAMGYMGNPLPSQREVYDKFRAMGVEQAVMMAAARENQRMGKGTPAQQQELLQSWVDMGITTDAQLQAYRTRCKRLNALCKKAIRAWGETRPPREGDLRLWENWENMGFGEDMILLAAGYAVGTANPSAFCNRILENWHRSGIATLAAAKEDHEKRTLRPRQEQGTARPATPAAALDSRTYSDADFDALYADFDNFDINKGRSDG